MKTAIVCEGGGMRGVFTAGVLQSFLEADFVADALIGVSAGASNGCSYVSKQKGRGRRTNIDYCGDKRYLSIGNFLRDGSIFGMDFVFGELPQKLDPFDFATFEASPCNFYAGATDVHTGQIHYFGKQDMDKDFTPIRASCSLPMLSNIVQFQGHEYLDGGIAEPIPVNKALQEGCDKIIVILTRERGYVKKPQSFRTLYSRQYRKYPAFVRAMDLRHVVYNQTLREIAQLEKQGIVSVIAPPAPLPVDRFGQDKQKMITSYTIGMDCGQKALQTL